MASNELSPRPVVQLRATTPADVPALFKIQLDPEGNALAGTKPRDRDTFEARWAEFLRDPIGTRVTPRVILADGVLAGSINIFPQDGADSIGYWLDRSHWGRGIATRAIALLLEEVPIRPLFARVVAHNAASQRALQRNGFVLRGREQGEETDRYTAAEVLLFMLAGSVKAGAAAPRT